MIRMITTSIPDDSDDSFHLSQTESETDDEEIRSSWYNNILTEKKYIVSLSSLKSIQVFFRNIWNLYI